MWKKCPDLDNGVCEACSYQGAVVRYIDSCDTARNIHKTEVVKYYVKNMMHIKGRASYLYIQMLGMLSGPRLALL